MTFIHDTRDRPGKHENVVEGLKALGHKVIRTKMYVGDITLLADQSVCIDLKASLNEVESNLVHQHARFRAECKRAQDAGITLIVLVEDEGIADISGVPAWVNPRRLRWEHIRLRVAGKRLSEPLPSRPPIGGRALYAMMTTMTARYGVRWVFTKKAEAAQKVIALLEVS